MTNWYIVFRHLFLVSLLTNITIIGITQDTVKPMHTGLEELLNTKVVAASRKPQTITEAPANVLVITAEQIANRGYLTIQDILKDLPGFDFSTDQPSGEYPANFLLRGIGSVGQTKVALLIDGISQNDVSNGWIRHIGYNFTLNDIERIEFVSGPGSALYGGNAHAGYINIITKSANDNKDNRVHINVNMLGGTQSTYSPSLLASYKAKNGLAFQFSGRYFSSKGDNGIGRLDPGNYFQNNYEPDSVLTFNQGIIANEKNPDGSSKSLNDGYKTNIDDYYFRAKIENNELSINFSAWRKKEGLGNEVPAYEYFANTDLLDYQIHHTGKSFSIGYKFEASKSITSQSRMYFLNNSVLPETGFTYTWGYQSVNNGVDSIITDQKKQYTSEGFMVGVDQQINAKLSSKNNLLVGFQVEQKIREYFDIVFVEGVPVPVFEIDSISNTLRPHTEYISKNGAFFINDEQKILKHIKLNAGIRYDYDEFYGNIINPKIAITRSVKKGFNYKIILGQGFRPPSIFELYDEWRGNKNLSPETIKTFETEFGYVNDKMTITSNVFYSELSNIIEIGENLDTVAIPIGIAGQHIDYYQNISEKKIYGISVNGNAYLNKYIFVFGNYQFLGDAAYNEGIDNVAEHKLNFGFNALLFKKLNINLRGNWVGKTKAPASNRYFQYKTPETIQEIGYDYVTEENPDGHSDSFMVLNGAITGKNLVKGKNFQIEPYFIIKNILDTKYILMGRQSGNGSRPIDDIQSQIRNPNGFIPAYHPQPGRQILIGIKFLFK